MKKLLALFLLTATAAFAQNPQAPANTPIVDLNAKYVNGIAPGYAPTKGALLVLNIGPGTGNCGGTIVTYAGGTLSMTNSTTNYVYLDTLAGCALTVSTSTFTSTQIPIAVVVAAGGSITTITDDRTSFTSGSSAYFLGTYNVMSCGAKGDGTTDDTAAFNTCIAAAYAAPSGAVIIPWTASFYKLSGTLSLANPDGKWLNIIQAGTIHTANTITLDKFIQWTGIGGIGPSSFQFQSASLVEATANNAVFLITGEQVVLKNLLVLPSGISTTAHTIQITNAINISLINVTVSMSSGQTGDAVHVDLSPGGGFGLFVYGGAYNSGVDNTNHATFYLRDIGIITLCPDFIGTYGIKLVHDNGSGGGEGMHVGGAGNQITTEALLDDFLILQEDDANGINNIWLTGISNADLSAPSYYVRTSGSGGGSISNIFLTDLSGGSGLLNPASTKNVQGLWTQGTSPVTIPANSAGGIQFGQVSQFYANSVLNGALNVARGHFVAGAPDNGNTNDVHHFYDVTNGGNGISMSSLPAAGNGVVLRHDSAKANAVDTYESPNTGEYQLDFITPGGDSSAITMNHNNHTMRFAVHNQAKFDLYGATVGGFPAAPFAVFNSPILISNDGTSTNYIQLKGTPTGGRTATFPDTSGTVSYTNVMNHSGTITDATHIVQDTATLSTGTVTVTLTGNAVFTGATTYVCSAIDTTTAANVVLITQTSGSSITFAASGATDVIAYGCFGH